MTAMADAMGCGPTAVARRPGNVDGLTFVLYSPLDPGFVGGLRSWITGFWREYLARTNSRLVVAHVGFMPKREGEVCRVDWDERVMPCRIPAVSFPGFPAPLPRVDSLRELLTRTRAQVLYVDNAYALQDVAALTAARYTNCATISGHHAVIRHSLLHSLAWGTVGRRAASRFDAVHVLNPADAKYLRALGCRNVWEAPLGTDAGVFQCPTSKPRPLRICFVGRLHWQKGVDRLVSLMRTLLARHGGGIAFEIVGDGPERWRLAGATGLAQVTYRGQLDQAGVADVLRRSSILLMPSRDETFGLVAAEALMCGTAVLYTDIPALRNLVPEFGGVAVANTNDAEAWSSSAESLIDRVERLRTPAVEPAKLRDYAIGRVSFAAVTEKFRKLVESAIAEKA